MLQLKKGQLIVFDGDSLTNRRSAGRQDTWPFLRLMNWDKPWPDVVAEMLFCWRPELKLSFFNAASGGSTCRGLAGRFETNVFARKPSWYIASLAGNDARVGIPLDQFRETMSGCAKQLIDEYGTEVLFFGLSEAPPEYPKMDTMDARREYYSVLRDIAEKTEGVHYADIGPRLTAKAVALKEQADCHTIYGDGSHFNAVGNLLMAGEILRLFGVVTEG